MRLSFYCMSNMGYPWVNSAVFKTKDGSVIALDRDATEFDYDPKDRRMSMYWRCVYLWDDEDADYNIADDFLDGATFEGFEVEDDAPDGYYIRCLAWHYE